MLQNLNNNCACGLVDSMRRYVLVCLFWVGVPLSSDSSRVLMFGQYSFIVFWFQSFFPKYILLGQIVQSLLLTTMNCLSCPAVKFWL